MAAILFAVATNLDLHMTPQEILPASFYQAWLIASTKRPKDQNDAILSHHEPQPYDVSWYGMTGSVNLLFP